MKRLIFLGSILGTMATFLAACLAVLATLAWLVRRWHAAPWLLWTVGLSLLAVAIAVIWHWWRLPKERRFRFSLRGMLISIALFALWFGVVGTDVLRWGREATAIAELQQQHVTTFEYYCESPHRPLVGRFGYDPFAEVQNTVILSDQGLAALLEHANDLPGLEWVCFEGASDAGLARVEGLNQFPGVRCGGIDSSRITDAGLERLTAWRRIEELWLANCPKITDSGLAHLKKLPNLTTLTLHQRHSARTMFVTDAGLAHVADLWQLQELRITRVPITDAGLDHLRDMPNLERVLLYKTEVTEAGVRRLCEALPDCLVNWDEAWLPAVCQIRCVEIWRVRPAERLLATITDVDQIAAVKAWFEQASRERYPNCSNSPAYWRDGRGEACLSVRFEGRRRRMHEVGLGNGVFSRWGSYCDMMPVDDEAIRGLLGVDATDWNAGGTVD